MQEADKNRAGDLLINELFIHGKTILLPFLSHLFNFILDSECFPSQWSEGLLIHFFKKGDPFEASIYRDITLFSFNLQTGIRP